MIDGRRIAILVEDGFEVSETFESMHVLKNAGAKVLYIGGAAGKRYQGKWPGAELYADDSAQAVDAFDFDAVIVPGGWDFEKVQDGQSMVKLVGEAYHAGRIVAAICRGPQLLELAGILAGKHIACCSEIESQLVAAGAQCINRAVVRDGNIITARKAADIPKFNKAIVEALC